MFKSVLGLLILRRPWQIIAVFKTAACLNVELKLTSITYHVADLAITGFGA